MLDINRKSKTKTLKGVISQTGIYSKTFQFLVRFFPQSCRKSFLVSTDTMANGMEASEKGKSMNAMPHWCKHFVSFILNPLEVKAQMYLFFIRLGSQQTFQRQIVSLFKQVK